MKAIANYPRNCESPARFSQRAIHYDRWAGPYILLATPIVKPRRSSSLSSRSSHFHSTCHVISVFLLRRVGNRRRRFDTPGIAARRCSLTTRTPAIVLPPGGISPRLRPPARLLRRNCLARRKRFGNLRLMTRWSTPLSREYERASIRNVRAEALPETMRR